MISIVKEQPRREVYYNISIGVNTKDRKRRLKGTKKWMTEHAEIHDFPPRTKRGIRNCKKVYVKYTSESTDHVEESTQYIHNFSLVGDTILVEIRDKSI